MSRQEFWPHDTNEEQFRLGCVMELRVRIALNLIERYGAIAGTLKGEDTAGRAKVALQEPAALVTRCFDIAELTVETAIARGFLRQPAQTIEQVMEATGRLNAIKHETESRRWRFPVEDRKV